MTCPRSAEISEARDDHSLLTRTRDTWLGQTGSTNTPPTLPVCEYNRSLPLWMAVYGVEGATRGKSDAWLVWMFSWVGGVP